MWEKKYSSHSETIPLLQFLATTAVLYYIHSRWYMGGRDRKTNEGHTPSLKHAHTQTHHIRNVYIFPNNIISYKVSRCNNKTKAISSASRLNI